MTPVDVPVDFISVGVSLAVGIGEVVGGVFGVCVMKNVVHAGVGFFRHVVSGVADNPYAVEDVKIDRGVRVRRIENTDCADYQINGQLYRNADWRDGRDSSGWPLTDPPLRDEDDGF